MLKQDVPIERVGRLLTLVLLASFGLPSFAPLLSVGAPNETTLPACCRRHGKHHCTMGSGEVAAISASQSGFGAPQERCPFSPQMVASPFRMPLALTSAAAVIIPARDSQAGAVAQCTTGRHAARDRAWPKRGPPSLLLVQTA